MAIALLWFRSDLRLHDLPALAQALEAADRVVPCFVLDEALLAGRYASSPRAQFMAGCLRALDAELRARGSALVLRRGEPARELAVLARETGATSVHWTSDVSPYARARDARVSAALREQGVAARPATGGYCVDVSRVRTGTGTPFSVFTPFWKAWLDMERRPVLDAPSALPSLPGGLRSEPLSELGELPAQAIVEPGEPAARAALARWLADGVGHYAERHDRMARRGTSLLSPHLRFGCLSARECEQRARDHDGQGTGAWVRQLCWREFYAQVLLANPANVREEQQPRYRGTLEWSDDEGTLEAWQRGETGYPLVDAGMRELAATGWMHNRVRLVVGSFLTKDLHHDWRSGERWFARLLLDGEPAQNNGNWQWIASVGVDPAPAARRIYNPALQQARFDPRGNYVRCWVPELARVPDRHLGEPSRMDAAAQRAAGCELGRDYPEPIVDHLAERRVAIERYRAAAGGDGG